MQNDIFCSIISKTVPAYIVYEDDYVIAFLDIEPFSQGHVLVVPKQHYSSIDTVPNNVITAIFKTARDLSVVLQTLYKHPGIKLMQNNGALADVDHVHVHVIGKDPKNSEPLFKSFKDDSEKNKFLLDTANQIKDQLASAKL